MKRFRPTFDATLFSVTFMPILGVVRDEHNLTIHVQISLRKKRQTKILASFPEENLYNYHIPTAK